ncbi:MAG: hypothetical protein LBB61_09640 [Treponema sp.]|jgi:hypothetical protein|nr:hypothetical protein [Treponema sp.]
MKAGNGKHFEQSYNAQAAVYTETIMVVGKYITNHANDKQELGKIAGSVDGEVYEAETVSTDTGYFSAVAVRGRYGGGAPVVGAGADQRSDGPWPGRRERLPPL